MTNGSYHIKEVSVVEEAKEFAWALEKILKKQGWMHHDQPLRNDDGNVYTYDDVVSLRSPKGLYYGNIWWDESSLFIMAGDAKAIVGNSKEGGFLLLYSFRTLKKLYIITNNNIEDFLTEELLKENL